MTVSYTHEVATGRGFGNFWRLLGRWRGSIYKVVIPELIVYAIIFGIISLNYRLWISKDEKSKFIFEKFVKYCEEYAGMIPVSFVLGFYIAQIVTRWWNQFISIPWPDRIAAFLVATLHGEDETSRLMRRTIMRHVNLSFILTMSMISPQAKTRFPTMDHLVDAGFMMPHEKAIIDALHAKSDLPKFWVPLIWAGNIVVKAREENRIREDLSYINVLQSIMMFRQGCGELLGYDWVCIPLVYTQVVTLAVYLYFGAALFGKQFVTDEDHLDIYVPVFLFLEFFFYTGWLKVAETMVNPFGKDDDDFEVNWLIDRNITISFMIVDEMKADFPEMVRDRWWDEVIPRSLPYTKAARQFKTSTHYGSANFGEQKLSGDPQDFEFVREHGKDADRGNKNVKINSRLGFNVPMPPLPMPLRGKNDGPEAAVEEQAMGSRIRLPGDNPSNTSRGQPTWSSSEPWKGSRKHPNISP